MRGKAARQATMLTVITPDALVPQGHPIRRIKPMVDRALGQLSSTFDGMYADLGRASIPPEHRQLACLPICTIKRHRLACRASCGTRGAGLLSIRARARTA